MTALETAKKIVSILDQKKAVDIKAIEVGEITSIADAFVIASGNNPPQVRALSDAVEEELSKLGMEPRRIEGYDTATWIVLDYYDVIVHIFHTDARQFYSLERLWSDGKMIDLSGLVTD